MGEIKRLGDFVSGFIKSSKIKKRKGLDDISEIWSDIVGNRVAKVSRVLKVYKDVITIEVESPALSQEISVFMKDSILAKVNKLFPKKRITTLKCITNGRKR